MSPEQVCGEPVDARTDLFSLGVLLFEMATGRRPFEGPNDASIIVALLNRPVPPTGYSELDRVIGRATARRPELRYQRAIDLLADLRALATGESPKAPPPPRAASVAVLPFSNMSADADQEYFCDGMAEELISALSRIKGLAVAARTSTFQFKGQQVDVREIGGRLGVESVLEGSVRKLGNRLRITAQLVNVQDGYQIWSDRYDRTIDDVFAIQDEIAHAITESLKVTLTRSTGSRIVKKATENLDAYHLYLRGRFLLNRLTDLQDALPAARQCFEQSVALDPNYAPAHAALSEACNALGYTTLLPAPEASSAALAAARRAIELDPELPEAHTALGWTKTLFAIDIGTAEQDFQRALELAPHASAHAYYALLLACFGRFEEALSHAESARHLDPLWLVVPFIVCQILICARRFETAERQMREMMALGSRFDGAYWYLSSALAGQHRLDEAIEVLERGVEMVRRVPFFITLLGVWYARAGRKADAAQLYRELVDGGRSSSVQLAIVSAELGEMERAFSHLDRAIAEHNDQISFMAFDHRFDAFRRDARFEAALRRVGLPVDAV
jgi:TolB-like protein/Flp pilus assembly protein TadD